MSKLTIRIAEKRAAAFGGNVVANIAERLLNLGYNVNQAYQDEDEPEVITLSYSDGEYQLPFVVSIDPSLGKSVQITKINDAEETGEFIGGGEVVESWGNTGWDLTIRGLIIDTENHNRPLQQILEFVNVIRKNALFEVSGKLFNSIDVRRIYITNVSFPALEGFKDTQPYVIQARSYVPAVLQITD